MPRYDVPNAAPEPLRLVQQFVNTSDHEHSRELLATPAGLAEWIAAAGVAPVRRAMSADVGRARELREALRDLLAANGGGVAAPAGSVATLNRAAKRGGLALELDPSGRPAFVASRADVPGALAQIVGVAAAAMLDGSWARLKTCRNCRWAFYDYSRNRSAAWCSMSICGNRVKTRRYRERASIRRVDRGRG